MQPRGMIDGADLPVLPLVVQLWTLPVYTQFGDRVRSVRFEESLAFSHRRNAEVCLPSGFADPETLRKQIDSQ